MPMKREGDRVILDISWVEYDSLFVAINCAVFQSRKDMDPIHARAVKSFWTRLARSIADPVAADPNPPGSGADAAGSDTRLPQIT